MFLARETPQSNGIIMLRQNRLTAHPAELRALHPKAEGQRAPLSVSDDPVSKAREHANALAGKTVSRNFALKPEKSKCSQCDVRLVFQYGQAR